MPDSTDLHSHDHRHGPFAVVLVVVLCVFLGLLAGSGATWFWFQRQLQQTSTHDQVALEQKLQQLRLELDAERARANELHGQLVVERSTIKGLESALGAAQSDLGAANDKLAFYDQLLPPGPQGSVGIRALEIFPVGPNLLQYRLLLTRNAQGRKPFEGRLQFLVRGIQQEPGPAGSIAVGQRDRVEGGAASPSPARMVTVELFPARAESGLQVSEVGPEPGSGVLEHATASSVDGLKLTFDQFQRSEGLLGLPAGFMPDHITVNVLEEGRVRASTTVELTTVNLL